MGFIKKNMHSLFRDITSLGGLAFFLLVLLLTLPFPDLFLRLLFGFFITQIIGVGARLIYFKERPNKEAYSNIFEKITASSFPSIHTSRSFFLAATFMQITTTTYLQIVLIAIALIVGYSRVFLKKHDWIDVSAGIVIGLLTSWIAFLW